MPHEIAARCVCAVVSILTRVRSMWTLQLRRESVVSNVQQLAPLWTLHEPRSCRQRDA